MSANVRVVKASLLSINMVGMELLLYKSVGELRCVVISDSCWDEGKIKTVAFVYVTSTNLPSFLEQSKSSDELLIIGEVSKNGSTTSFWNSNTKQRFVVSPCDTDIPRVVHVFTIFDCIFGVDSLATLGQQPILYNTHEYNSAYTEAVSSAENRQLVIVVKRSTGDNKYIHVKEVLAPFFDNQNPTHEVKDKHTAVPFVQEYGITINERTETITLSENDLKRKSKFIAVTSEKEVPFGIWDTDPQNVYYMKIEGTHNFIIWRWRDLFIQKDDSMKYFHVHALVYNVTETFTFGPLRVDYPLAEGGQLTQRWFFKDTEYYTGDSSTISRLCRGTMSTDVVARIAAARISSLSSNIDQVVAVDH